MNRFVALVRRELGVYFVSPLAYIILTIMMLIFGLFFRGQVMTAAQFNLPFSFGQLLFPLAAILVLVSPLITMRLIAEEKNRGTIETLMTAPVSELQVVLAKYVGSLLFMAYLLLPTVAHVILAGKYGTVDVPATMTGYLGIFMITSAVFSIGLFVSAVCSSQITAGVVTFALTFLLTLTSVLSEQVPEKGFGLPMREIVQKMDPYAYLQDFQKGVLDLRPITYYISIIVFFVFLSVRALESRRWR